MSTPPPLAPSIEKSRDDFSESTKRKLRDRVAGRCSNPDCRTPTLGPKSDEGGVSSIGIAAHITAAAPLGPRYNRSLSPQQRSAFKNGIWLCSNHAAMIDRDDVKFPESLLRGWKCEAESAARNEQGRKLPSDADTVNTLKTVLSGSATKVSASAIRNVHSAASQTLSALDTRFRVVSSYSKGITQFEIVPQQPVELAVVFDIARAPEVPSKMEALFAHGRSFEIDASVVTWRGSPLFDHISAEATTGKFGISPTRRSVKVKLWTEHGTGSDRHNLDDIDGHIVGGTKSVHVEASGLGGLLTIAIDVPLAPPVVHANLTLSVDFACWQMVDVQRLPYLKSLTTFVNRLANGFSLSLSVEADGNPIFTPERIDLSNYQWVRNLRAFLEYIRLAQSLTSILKLPLKFENAESISSESFDALAEMERVATGRFRLSKDQIKSNPRFTVTPSVDGERLLAEAHKEQVIRMQAQPTSPIEVFGQILALPNRMTTMYPVRIRLVEADAGTTAGRSKTVELEMLQNFELLMEFEKPQ